MQAVLQNPKSWFSHERRVWVVGLIAAGAFGFVLGNGHTTENSIAFVANELGICRVQKNEATVQAKAAKAQLPANPAPAKVP